MLSPVAGRGEHAKRYSQAGSRGYRCSPEGDDRRPIIRAEAQHAPGSNRPTISTSSLSNRPHRSTNAMMPVFHEVSRAERPSQQTTKSDGLSHLLDGAGAHGDDVFDLHGFFDDEGLAVFDADLVAVEAGDGGETFADFLF